MKNQLLVCLFLLLSVSVKAQYGILKGLVLDEKTKQPIAGASIFEKSNFQNATNSNANGNYEISLVTGNHTIICSFVGMISDTFKVIIESGNITVYNVLLKQKPVYINTVVITAGKYEQKLEETTVSMELLKPKLIEEKNVTRLDKALEQLPGITILDEEPQIRGGSGFTFGVGSRVSTLIDGIPILSGDVGRADWDFIPLENIEQVEVIKGASSVLYGSSALSGVINVLTTYPKEEQTTKATVYSGFYSAPKNESAKWWDGAANYSGFNFLHSNRYEQFDVVVGGMAKYDHNYIGPPVYIPSLPQLVDTLISEDDIATKAGRLNFNTRYRPKNKEGLSLGINGNIMYSHDNFSLIWMNDTDGIYTAFPKTMTLSKSFQFYVDPFITYYSKDGLKHDIRSRIFYQNNQNSNDQSNISTVYYFEYKANKMLSVIEGLNFTAGLVMNQTRSKANLFAYQGQPKNSLSNYAVYTQLDKKMWNVLNASVGFRGEYFQMNNSESVLKPILRAGLNLKLAKATFIRYSYGQGYRYPTIAEKYIYTSTGGIDLFPNPDLNPETSWNTEAGVNQGYRIGKFQGYIDLAAFWQEFQNTIEYNYAIWGTEQPGFKFLNTGSTRVRGLDFTWVGEGQLTKDLKMTVLAGFTYIKPQALDPNLVYAVDSNLFPKQLSYVSTSTDTTDYILKYRFTTTAKADISFQYKKVSAGFSVRYYSFIQNIDKTFYDLDQTVLPVGIVKYREEHNGGTTVFDFRFGVAFAKAFNASIIVSNFMNLEYSLRPLKIEAPRTIAIQINYKI